MTILMSDFTSQQVVKRDSNMRNKCCHSGLWQLRLDILILRQIHFFALFLLISDTTHRDSEETLPKAQSFALAANYIVASLVNR